MTRRQYIQAVADEYVFYMRLRARIDYRYDVCMTRAAEREARRIAANVLRLAPTLCGLYSPARVGIRAYEVVALGSDFYATEYPEESAAVETYLRSLGRRRMVRTSRGNLAFVGGP
jgi:hypothetical protein